MDFKSTLMLFVASWPFLFMAGWVALLKRQVNREQQYQLNDAIKALQNSDYDVVNALVDLARNK